MPKEVIDRIENKSNHGDRFMILYIAVILLFVSVSYHIYLIYSMRQQAIEFAKRFKPQGFYFVQYHISFIPLYGIAGITGVIILWWISRNRLRTTTNLIGALLLILTCVICFIPTDKWFG